MLLKINKDLIYLFYFFYLFVHVVYNDDNCEGLTSYIHLAYHDLRVVRWSVKIAVANLTVFISVQKKSRLNDTQIKIRFYDLFHHLHLLLRCDPVCDQLNTGRLMTSRHKWLIIELKSDEQILFSWKTFYHESEYLIVQ